MVTKAEALGGVGDGGDGIGGRTGNLEEELMLLGVQIDLVSGLFAELQEGCGAGIGSQPGH